MSEAAVYLFDRSHRPMREMAKGAAFANWLLLSVYTNPLRPGHANRVSCASRQVECDAPSERTSVIDSHRDRPSVRRISDRYLRSKRQAVGLRGRRNQQRGDQSGDAQWTQSRLLIRAFVCGECENAEHGHRDPDQRNESEIHDAVVDEGSCFRQQGFGIKANKPHSVKRTWRLIRDRDLPITRLEGDDLETACGVPVDLEYLASGVSKAQLREVVIARWLARGSVESDRQSAVLEVTN
jgi:hypothetical protein